MMNNYLYSEVNNLFFVCNLIEYVAYKTKNDNKTIVNALGHDGISHFYYNAYDYYLQPPQLLFDKIKNQYKLKIGSCTTAPEKHFKGRTHHKEMINLVDLISKKDNDIVNQIIGLYTKDKFEHRDLYDSSVCY